MGSNASKGSNELGMTMTGQGCCRCGGAHDSELEASGRGRMLESGDLGGFDACGKLRGLAVGREL